MLIVQRLDSYEKELSESSDERYLFSDSLVKLQTVKIFDNQRRAIIELVLKGNHKIEYDYFRDTFSNATGKLARKAEGYIRFIGKKKQKENFE